MAPSNAGPQIFDDTNRASARSSVFRAIMSKPHKRNQSAGDVMTPQYHQSKPSGTVPFPFAEGRAPAPGHLPLGEIVPNRDAGETNLPAQNAEAKDGKGALHKKTKSAVSLKSLRSYMERRSEDTSTEDSSDKSPKKTKSSNSLSAILKRSQRGRKGEGSKQSRDKENRSPTDLVDNMPSPIGPQTAPIYQDSVNRSGQNSTADRRRSVADEVSLYTPKGYSPALQRNFYDYHQPSLARPGEAKPRPKSDILAGNRKMKEFLGPLKRAPLGESDAAPMVDSASSRMQGSERSRKTSAPESPAPAASKEELNPKRLSRVQAAISAFNAKERDTDAHEHLNSKDLESEFEKLLVCLSRSTSYPICQSNTLLGCKEHPSQHERQDAIS